MILASLQISVDVVQYFLRRVKKLHINPILACALQQMLHLAQLNVQEFKGVLRWVWA